MPNDESVMLVLRCGVVSFAPQNASQARTQFVNIPSGINSVAHAFHETA